MTLKRTLLAGLQIGLGLAAGLLLVEVVLRLNPQLLIPGTPLAGSLAVPLTSQTYTVRYSDGDTFFWRPDLIRPIAPGADQVEAVVTLTTDEFGFRNPPPAPAQVGLVVLGRSTSLGAQSAQPWPELLAATTNTYVLNLAQPSGGLDTVRRSFDTYGRPRRPNWVIFEVAPRLDASDSGEPAFRLQGVAVPMLQYLARRLAGDRLFRHADQPIYPLSISLPGRTLGLTCCLYYLDFLALSRGDLEGSRQWANLRAQVLALAADARAAGSCVAALYAVSKEEVYFSAALDPSQLAPALASVVPLHLDQQGDLAPAVGAAIGPAEMQGTILAGRDAMAALARQAGIVFIDPTGLLIQSVQAGQDPYLLYDSHWNALGQHLIAGEAERALHAGPCP